MTSKQPVKPKKIPIKWDKEKKLWSVSFNGQTITFMSKFNAEAWVYKKVNGIHS